MLKRLSIRNYAIIDELDLELAEGLSIITGETGAGKSILLGGLGLILGKRADTKSLLDPSRKCVVEGCFDIEAYKLRDFFEAHELDYDEELIVRREITPSGKSRSFVNDTPVRLNLLQSLGAFLVDLHQQFDTLYINNGDFQLELLDALADQRSLVSDFRRSYRRYLELNRELEDLQEKQRQATREQDFLSFQVNELREAELQAGEMAQLEAEQHRLSQAEDIQQICSGIARLLTDDETSVGEQLSQASAQLHQLTGKDTQITQLYERLHGLELELQALSEELTDLADGTEGNPQRLQEVDQRLSEILRLLQKHGLQNEAALIEEWQKLEDQLANFTAIDDELAAKTVERDQLLSQLTEMGESIRAGRQHVAPAFASQIVDQLSELAMPEAQLEIDFKPLESPGPHGLDEVNFLFSANRGSRLQRIKDAASGGEMSRLALVTKRLVAAAMALPTLIFDEIDSGVSGDVAQKMGRILKDLSGHHQVVVITHSPQVAGRADRHFFIYKSNQSEDERTTTKLRLLNEDERVRAIATMLSQSPPSDSALENARELIAG
ncbi:MAG: DNA repair protein RecN [Bacteroidota bacterium]